MNRIPQLPKWALTNIFPSFYDFESLTVVDQTARLYAAMQGMIDDYNKFSNELNVTIEEFINNVNADQEEFENKITKIVHDYIESLDLKIQHQDRQIAEAIEYMKTNLTNSLNEILIQMKESGEFDAAVLDTINSINTRLEDLETTNNTANERITANANAINSINTRLEDLETTNNTANERITANANAITAINEKSKYTADEQIVGTWIDGNIIYRKVIRVENPECTDTGDIVIGTNIIASELITFKITVKNKDGYWRTIPWLYDEGNMDFEGGAGINVFDGVLQIWAGSQLRQAEIVNIILEYTKATE